MWRLYSTLHGILPRLLLMVVACSSYKIQLIVMHISNIGENRCEPPSFYHLHSTGRHGISTRRTFSVKKKLLLTLSSDVVVTFVLWKTRTQTHRQTIVETFTTQRHLLYSGKFEKKITTGVLNVCLDFPFRCDNTRSIKRTCLFYNFLKISTPPSKSIISLKTQLWTWEQFREVWNLLLFKTLYKTRITW